MKKKKILFSGSGKSHLLKSSLSLIVLCFFILNVSQAQVPVDLSEFNPNGEVGATTEGNSLGITWPAGEKGEGKIEFSLQPEQPLFSSIQLSNNGISSEIASGLDPVFILTEGQRDLTRESGWNIFFDRTAYLPYEIHLISMDRQDAKVVSTGSRTQVIFSGLSAGEFSGTLEITIYNGSPLLKTEAVVSTDRDSAAIIYDAGFIDKEASWEEIFWADTDDHVQSEQVGLEDGSRNLAVKYRTIIGESEGGSIALFPPPHQYFYPLDNAYNLQYTWYGNNYRELIPEYGIGIRHELLGDRRHVPWFNAPPGTQQRLSFFTVLSTGKDGQVLEDVKKFTNGDSYRPLPGHKTMASHFHTKHIDDILTHKPLPEIPGHVKVMRNLGVNIMPQGEFHLSGNPRDPGPRRLPELKMMFQEFERLSGGDFLMLPGEEPNVHFGGHWMIFFLSRFTGLCQENRGSLLWRRILNMEKYIGWVIRKRC